MALELAVSGLSRTYPNGVRALQDVDLHIPTGMFGLLGPNGAGKSTLLDHFAILEGLVHRAERRDILDSLLRQTNLWEARKRKLGTWSGGMKQRFGFAQALLGNPRLLIVDEPTAGLDPAERNRFLNLLDEVGENIVVIMSVIGVFVTTALVAGAVLRDHELGTHELFFSTPVTKTAVDVEPRRAGIDPYNKLIDRNPEDNVTNVTRSGG